MTAACKKRLDLPAVAIVARQPLWFPCTVSKGEFLWIPSDGLAMIVSHIREVAADCGPSSDSCVTIRLLARAHTAEEIGQMIAAAVERNFCILQVFLFDHCELRVQRTSICAVKETGNRLASELELESPAIHRHFALAAEEAGGDITTVVLLDAIRIH